MPEAPAVGDTPAPATSSSGTGRLFSAGKPLPMLPRTEDESGVAGREAGRFAGLSELPRRVGVFADGSAATCASTIGSETICTSVCEACGAGGAVSGVLSLDPLFFDGFRHQMMRNTKSKIRRIPTVAPTMA